MPAFTASLTWCKPLDRIADHGHAGEHFLHFRFQTRIQGIHAHAVQRLGQAANARANRHLIVVEHDNQVLFQPSGVVQCLQDDAGTEGPVAHDRHRTAVFLGPYQVIGTTHAQGATRSTTGMARKEQVVRTFGRIGISHEAAADTHGMKVLVAPGEKLVRVDLMTGVPDQSIAAEVEGRVQGQGEFNHAQVGGKMRRPPRCEATQGLADLGGQLGQFLMRQPLQIARGADRGKNLVHQRFLSKT